MTQEYRQESRDGSAGSSAQRMFGSQAAMYATSQVHIHDNRLTTLQRMIADFSAARWALDLGTGAGFTAFAAADHAANVVASDVTLEMLLETRRIAGERSLSNVGLCQNRAEALPFACDSIDLVTCRAAGHHFTDLGAAFEEIHRILKPGGALVMADSVSPEDDALAQWYNDVELRRDFSHVENRKVSVLLRMLADRGLNVVEQYDERTYMMFNDWVTHRHTRTRSNYPAPGLPESIPQARETFLIEEQGVDIAFAWPSLVFRAVKV